MDLDQAALADVLAKSYRAVTDAVSGNNPEALLARTRCRGWIVRDFPYHQLLDARRALQTYTSPAQSEPDVDDITYWAGSSPTADRDGAVRHADFVRAISAIYSAEMLVREWRETSESAARDGQPVTIEDGASLFGFGDG